MLPSHPIHIKEEGRSAGSHLEMRGGGGRTRRQGANVSMVAAFRGPTEIGRRDVHKAPARLRNCGAVAL